MIKGENNMKWEMFDMNLTKDEMQAIMNEYMAHIKERQKSLQDYIEISEILISIVALKSVEDKLVINRVLDSFNADKLEG